MRKLSFVRRYQPLIAATLNLVAAIAQWLARHGGE